MKDTILEKVKKSFLTPISAFKLRYLPLLMIYFAYGTQAIAAVALMFWKKEFLDLSAEKLMAITVWVSLPFTIKMIFGQLVDTYKLFGSKRKGWIYLGAVLMTFGYLCLYGMSKDSTYVTWMGSHFNMFLCASLLMQIGFVLQDVTADTMSAEVVDRNQTDDKLKSEIAMVQVLGRLAMMTAFAVGGGIGGYLAGKFSYETVFLIALIVPVISVLGAIFIKLDYEPEQQESMNPVIFGGGVLFAVFSIFMGFSEFKFAQEITFIVSFTLICWMMSILLKGQKKSVIKPIVLTFAALFVFRAVPTTGPGYSWWTIDLLGFDPDFFGVLRTMGSLSAVIVLWFASDYISKKPIKSVLILLTILGSFLSLPNIALYYNVHEVLGLSAKSISLLDTMAENPVMQLSMIPMLALMAYYAPKGKSATWFAVAASLMNLANTLGAILTKYLNKFFVVTREIKNKEGLITTAADYSNLGILLWITFIVGLSAPLIAILILLKDPPTKESTQL